MTLREHLALFLIGLVIVFLIALAGAVDVWTLPAYSFSYWIQAGIFESIGRVVKDC